MSDRPAPAESLVSAPAGGARGRSFAPSFSVFLPRLGPCINPRRRFPPTREGWWFLIATLLLGLAAINAGLNLLFLVWGMMLFLILASGVLSELCLRKLEARRSP